MGLLAVFLPEQKPPFTCAPEMDLSVKRHLGGEGPPAPLALIKLTSLTFSGPSAAPLLVPVLLFSRGPAGGGVKFREKPADAAGPPHRGSAE